MSPLIAGAAPPVPPPDPLRAQVVAYALSLIGTPYAFGGGDIHGPSLGIRSGASTVGFDCARYTRNVFYNGPYGIRGHIFLPYGSQAQARKGRKIGDSLADIALALPGDLCFFDGRHADGSENPADPAGHVGIFVSQAGTDQFGQHGPTIVHAPYPGTTVRLEVLNSQYFSVSPGGIRSYLPRPVVAA